ncbi:MAG: M28 family peptidase [Chitinophagaceae bacterium]|nr:M28 family peptidase [Chitinophagaceae bacterium]
MKKIIGALFLLLAVGAAAQKTSPEQFGKTITVDDLKKHLYIIAGKEMEGRGTGTPGLERAAAYIEKQFKSIGLLPGNKDSYQYHYPLVQDSLEEAGIVIDDMNFFVGRHFNPNIRSAINQSLKGNEIVFMGYGIDDPAYSDYKETDVKGKIVLIVEGEPKINDTAYAVTGTSRRSPWSSGTSRKINAAQKYGATAVLLLQNTFPKYDPNRKITRGPLYPDFRAASERPAINQFNISDSVAMAIVGLDALTDIRSKAKANQSLVPQVFAKNIAMSCAIKKFKATTSNVVGILPGTDLKDEYVVITAHMDHLGKRDTVIYYGADDDGSGTCAVMEIAEAFAAAKKAGNGPRRSILFMTVSGEEMGLWGSEFYTSNPLFPLEKTTVNLNIDMIGRIGSDYTKGKDSVKAEYADSLNYVYVIGDDKLSTDLRPISELANNQFINLKLDYRYNDPKDPNRFYYRSDHYNFAQKGVPIIFYFDGVHRDYHRPTDTPDKINYELYARRAQLVFYTGWEMANRDKMVKRDMKLDVPARGF